jgi:hypothetical protein
MSGPARCNLHRNSEEKSKAKARLWCVVQSMLTTCIQIKCADLNYRPSSQRQLWLPSLDDLSYFGQSPEEESFKIGFQFLFCTIRGYKYPFMTSHCRIIFIHKMYEVKQQNKITNNRSDPIYRFRSIDGWWMPSMMAGLDSSLGKLIGTSLKVPSQKNSVKSLLIYHDPVPPPECRFSDTGALFYRPVFTSSELSFVRYFKCNP